MKLKEKYDELSIKHRAVIRTVMFILGVIAVPTFAVLVPGIFFPAVMLSALGFLCYCVYKLNLNILETRERFKK